MTTGMHRGIAASGSGSPAAWPTRPVRSPTTAPVLRAPRRGRATYRWRDEMARHGAARPVQDPRGELAPGSFPLSGGGGAPVLRPRPAPGGRSAAGRGHPLGFVFSLGRGRWSSHFTASAPGRGSSPLVLSPPCALESPPTSKTPQDNKPTQRK